MTASLPFDASLPSPLVQLAQMRARASESVVRDEQPSELQRLMAPAGRLEEALWEVLGGHPAPALLVLTGSAGSGKSATINHLLEREQRTGAGRVGRHLADATHADAPDQAQAARLAEFFADFADGAPPVQGPPCRVIAMNTGMALRFFHDLERIADAPPLRGLERLLRQRLGLPRLGAGGTAALSWPEGAVLVVNLDHRPTAGRPGDVFDELLQRLDPGRPDGVLQGAMRCQTCSVQDWCWPMANVAAISTPSGRTALNAAAGDVALTRGRQIAPRALWDLAAQLALGGAAQDGGDPCHAIARIAAEHDEQRLIQELACHASLDTAPEGTLAAEVAQRDPGYQPSPEAHAILTEAGLDPEADAQALRSRLSFGGVPHPAVVRAASILAEGKATPAGQPRYLGRVLARAAWLAGELHAASAPAGDFEAFAEALAAQDSGASEDDQTPEGRVLDAALSSIEEGIAAAFGLVSGPERYYPASAPPPGAKAELLVEAKLVSDGRLLTIPDPAVSGNPDGARLAGYRPLALSIEVAGRHIAVDYPLWRLLKLAAAGTPPSRSDLERFLALRQAIATVGVEAGSERGRPLLVREREAGGRRFRIVSRNATTLRATEVL